MPDMLESEFHSPYDAWKNTPGPATNAGLLTAVQPIITKGLRTYAEDNPVLRGKARMLTLTSMPRYDRQRSRLGTFLMNQYQGLRRLSRQQTQPIRLPERLLQERFKLDSAFQDLAYTLKREPSDAELAMHTGLSPGRISKIRTVRPATLESTLQQGDAQGILGESRLPGQPDGKQMWLDMVYSDLDPVNQRIMELTLGMRGAAPVSNQEIARRLQLSPGAISQRKKKIQELLDQETDYSALL